MSSNSKSIQSIIDRIEKLYALASGGATMSEAKAAIAMAEKLMKKYSIKEYQINKHTYTHGTGGSNPFSRSSRTSSRTSYRPSWEEYTARHNTNNSSKGNSSRSDSKSKQHTNQSRTQDHSWQSTYWNETIESGYRAIIADYMKETDKAYLINVYMNITKYPWYTKQHPIKVSIWVPKSTVKTRRDIIWIVKESIVFNNLNRNKEWLSEHHSVFKGVPNIEFHVQFAEKQGSSE